MRLQFISKSLLYISLLRRKLLLSMRSSVFVPALLLSVITTSISCEAQKKTAFKANNELVQTIQTDLEDGAKPDKVLKATLPPVRCPKTYFPQTGKSETSGSGW